MSRFSLIRSSMSDILDNSLELHVNTYDAFGGEGYRLG